MVAPVQPFCVGANVTLRLTLPAAVTTMGSVRPDTLNSELLTLIAAIVTLV